MSAVWCQTRRYLLTLSITAFYVKVFGRRPLKNLSTRTGAGVRKPPTDETASRDGDGASNAPMGNSPRAQALKGCPEAAAYEIWPRHVRLIGVMNAQQGSE